MGKVIKLRDEERIYGTSYHNATVRTSMAVLETKFGLRAMGESGDGKTSMELDLEVDDIPFSIYDWKEEPRPNHTTVLDFHIGTRTAEESKMVVAILKSDYGLDAKYISPEELRKQWEKKFGKF
jgi:hypothetical protein